jgi:hypothetical protein
MPALPAVPASTPPPLPPVPALVEPLVPPLPALPVPFAPPLVFWMSEVRSDIPPHDVPANASASPSAPHQPPFDSTR